MMVPNIWKAYLSEGDEVDVRRLDTLLVTSDRIDFIKCDVEGHEIQVVNGALEIIQRFKPVWLIESDWDSALFLRMRDLGYDCFVEHNRELVPRNGARKTNYFFLPRRE